MKIEHQFIVQQMHTFESKGGIERVGMIIGYLEGNNPGSAILYFPDPDCPSDPNWWWYSKQDRDHADPPLVKSVGSFAFPQGRCVRIELDYEDGHSAKRLIITDAQGIPFLSTVLGVYPTWFAIPEHLGGVCGIK